ncbi:hypothetical protein E2562_025972 [Oryza meyeriana var. granulata]|uniref:Uncharacterized protein n=1 Tax=Oryza meyeriana var. granulata TaxID=110450 RepID=A0A6G1EYX5_9ORYZ|nr:hypothetical protein E2562_025972 [Oryza meyeriana var. granulata]
MAFLLGMYGSGGGRRRMSENEIKGGGGGRRLAVAAPRPVRQLYRKLRSRLRPKRHAAAARFGYDQESYSRNFDGGGFSSPATRLPLQRF